MKISGSLHLKDGILQIDRTNNMADPVEDLAHGVNSVSLEDQGLNDNADTEDLPNVLIITNVDDSVFADDNERHKFEAVFQEFDHSATFQYLRSFRRARVEYNSPVLAAQARIHLQEAVVNGKRVKCYFAQPKTSLSPGVSGPHLEPPKPVKQFLISPPASPPVGWEPVNEATPMMNYDLLAALADLAPGEAHELHPPTESAPGIVVHVCEDPDGFAGRPPQIVQTKCPERKT